MFTPINNTRGQVEAGLPSTKFMEGNASYALAAAHPNVGPHSRSDVPQRMLGMMCDTVDYREDPKNLALRLASSAASAPERNVWVLWHKMLQDLELSPALDDFSIIGLDSVPAIRKWYVSHATFVQDMLSRCPRLRRMAVALKWLEDTFEVPEIANRVVPYTPGVKGCTIDPDLQRKIFLQLRAGRWERACAMAEEGSAFVSHIVSAAQMVAPNQSNNSNSVDARWRNNMPRATLFGEYETQASGNPRVRPTRNPHRLPLMLRMFEHLQKQSNNTSSADGNDISKNSNNNSSNNEQQEFFFDGIAGMICGDEASMRSACRAHFGSTPAAAQRNLRNNTSRDNQSRVNNYSSWQDELWSGLRSHLVAAFTTAIIRGANDAPNSNLVEQFEGVFSKQAIERFVSAMEARCGLSGEAASDDAAPSSSNTDWFHIMDASIGSSIKYRLKTLSSNFEPDSVDGIALQTLTLFLTDLERENSSNILSGITAKIAPVREEEANQNNNNSNNNSGFQAAASDDGMKFQRTTSTNSAVSGAAGSGGNRQRQQTYYLRWCLPEQASLCCLVSLAVQRQLIPGGAPSSPQSLPIYPEIIATMINRCLSDPHLEVSDFIQSLQTIAMYSALSQGDNQHHRIITHTAVLRCVRIRFVGDKGNFISNETNSAEGHMSNLLRSADAELYNGNIGAVDAALKAVAGKLRDDPSVPMIMHDSRCEALVWKSFMSTPHLNSVLIEAVATLKDLWNENRNLRAMQDVVDVWGRRLQELPSSNANANAAAGPSSPSKEKEIVKKVSIQIQFWSAVLKCHDSARQIAELVAQLVSSSSNNNNNFMPTSKRHDICVSAIANLDDLANKFFAETTRLCPTYGATAVCASLELLAEATRTLLPFVDESTMTRIFQQAFQKLVEIEACEFLGVAASDARSGVDLLPQSSAASLMQTLQALRTVYVGELQRRSAERRVEEFNNSNSNNNEQRRLM